MANIKQEYGTQGQVITISLGSLADSATAARQSTEIDNRTNKFLDALVTVKVKSAGTMAGDKAVYVYAFGTTDDGTTRTEGAGNTDAAITLNNPSNAKLIGVIPTPTTAVTYVAGPFSIASAFGGVMPALWGIIVRNKSGAALDSTGSNHVCTYQGIYASAN